MADEIREKVSVEVDGREKLEQLAKEQQEYAAKVDAAAAAADRAATREKHRDTQMSRFKRQLQELSLEELRHQQSVDSGNTVSDVSARRADHRRRRIERLSRAIAQKQRADEMAAAAVRKHTSASQENVGALGLAKDGVTSLVAGIAGAGGAMAVFQEWNTLIDENNQALRENAQLTNQQAEARLDLAALKEAETSGQIDQVNKLAIFAGTDPAQMARAVTGATSYFPDATEEDLRALLAEVALAKQSSSASVPELAGALGTIFQNTGDARMSGNIFQELVRQAGEDAPGKLQPLVAKLLPVGIRIGGLRPGQAAGMVAAVTGMGLQNEEAATGMRNVMLSFMGKGTPDGRKVLDREKIKGSLSDMLKQFSAAVQAGRISNAEMEAIGGRETVTMMTILSDPKMLNKTLGAMDAVDKASQYEGRIAQDKINSIIQSSGLQKFNLLGKQLDARLTAIKSQDEDAQRAETIRKALNLVIEEKIQSKEFRRGALDDILHGYDRAIGYGFSPETALDLSTMGVGLFKEDIYKVLDSITGDKTSIRSKVLDLVNTGPQTNPDALLNSEQPTQINPSIRPVEQYKETAQPVQSATKVINYNTNIANQNVYGSDPQQDFEKPFEAEDR